MTTTRVPRNTVRRLLFVLGGIWSAVLLQQCATPPAPAPEPAKNAWVADIKPTLTIRELMTHFIDPTADFVFDAVVFDSSTTGTNHIVPVSEDDWAKVERGAWQLAESANLLMIPRQAEPPNTPGVQLRPGERAPELTGGGDRRQDRRRPCQVEPARRCAARGVAQGDRDGQGPQARRPSSTPAPRSTGRARAVTSSTGIPATARRWWRISRRRSRSTRRSRRSRAFHAQRAGVAVHRHERRQLPSFRLRIGAFDA